MAHKLAYVVIAACVAPMRARSEDFARFHGTDERISVANYAELIGFHRMLITHAAGASSTLLK